MDDEERETLLIYDGQCPVCSRYCQLFEKSSSPVQLVDARGRPPILDEVESRGLDIDEGVVFKVGDKYYAGAAAINVLAEFSDRNSWSGRLNRWIFGSRRRAEWLYPLLRSGRGALLRILRRPKIKESEPRAKPE